MTEIQKYDEQVTKMYPKIEWRKPISISILPKIVDKLGCRLCIGRLGVKVGETEGKIFNNRNEFEEHMKEVHGGVQ